MDLSIEQHALLCAIQELGLGEQPAAATTDAAAAHRAAVLQRWSENGSYVGSRPWFGTDEDASALEDQGFLHIDYGMATPTTPGSSASTPEYYFLVLTDGGAAEATKTRSDRGLRGDRRQVVDLGTQNAQATGDGSYRNNLGDKTARDGRVYEVVHLQDLGDNKQRAWGEDVGQSL